MKKLFILLAVIVFTFSHVVKADAQNEKQKNKTEKKGKTTKADVSKTKTNDSKEVKTVVVKNQTNKQATPTDQKIKTTQVKKYKKTDLNVAKTNAPKNISKASNTKKAN
jgi:hypothetical protein